MNHLTKAVIVLSAVVGMNGAFAQTTTYDTCPTGSVYSKTQNQCVSKPTSITKCDSGTHYSKSQDACVANPTKGTSE